MRLGRSPQAKRNEELLASTRAHRKNSVVANEPAVPGAEAPDTPLVEADSAASSANVVPFNLNDDDGESKSAASGSHEHGHHNKPHGHDDGHHPHHKMSTRHRNANAEKAWARNAKRMQAGWLGLRELRNAEVAAKELKEKQQDVVSAAVLKQKARALHHATAT